MGSDLHSRNWLALACAAFGMLLAAGCGSPRRGAPVAGPLVGMPADVEEGRRVFMSHCHLCHPGGEGGLGPSLNEKLLPAAAIRMQVRRGLGVMPSFNEQEIPPERLEALIAYLLALRRQQPELAQLRP